MGVLLHYGKNVLAANRQAVLAHDAEKATRHD